MTILVQGAMNEEIDVLCEHFKPHLSTTIHGYEFFVCKYKKHKIIISLTKSGIINTTISTMLAIEEFSPDMVINQGCAGGHKVEHSFGDIIIGEKSVYINDFKTVPKLKGEGSSSLDWFPNPKRSYECFSTKKLIELAKKVSYDGKVCQGILGSGDMHSKEVDRIEYLTSLFNNDCEDMESVAALKVCDTFGIDKIALRIISDNELLKQEFDKSICKKMQEFAIRLIDLILSK